METANPQSCKDKLLYFSPSEDHFSYFTDSLIYVCDHNDEGAMGMIVNRTTNILTMDLFNSLKFEVHTDLLQKHLLLGGPVNPDAVFVLHGKPQEWDSSILINEDISLTTSGDVLRAIGLGKGPKNYLIAVGYSGWNPGQLDKELSENAWIETPSDQNILFNTPAKDQVDALSKKVGFDLRMVSPDFGNA